MTDDHRGNARNMHDDDHTHADGIAHLRALDHDHHAHDGRVHSHDEGAGAHEHRYAQPHG